MSIIRPANWDASSSYLSWKRLGYSSGRLWEKPSCKHGRRLAEVPLPNPDALGIDTLVYFWEKTWSARIPWNEGLRAQILEGNLGANFPLDPEHPVVKEGRVPMLDTPSYLSDVNKIAWVRAFLGWAYRCVKNKSRKGL